MRTLPPQVEEARYATFGRSGPLGHHGPLGPYEVWMDEAKRNPPDRIIYISIVVFRPNRPLEPLGEHQNILSIYLSINRFLQKKIIKIKIKKFTKSTYPISYS
jgi:hypothetical protein